MKNKRNKKNILTEENKKIDGEKPEDELKDVGKTVGILGFVGFLLLIIFSFITKQTDNDYPETQNRLLVLSIFAIIYNVIISIFTLNMFIVYKDIIILIIKRKFDFKDSLNQLALANLSNLSIAIIVLVFIVDWSLFGGYKVKIGTTLSVFIIFTLIEIIKRGWKSKFKK